MIAFKKIAMAAGVGLLAGPALSQVAPTGPQDALKAYMRDAGLSISWGQSNATGSHSFKLSDVTIKAEDWQLTTSVLLYNGREIDLMSVRVTGNNGDGDIAADRIALSELQAFSGLLNWLDKDGHLTGDREGDQGCEAMDTGTERARTIFVQNLSLTGDRDALPEGFLEAEHITAGLVALKQSSLLEEGYCTLVETTRASDIRITAADGAHVDVGAGMITNQFTYDFADGAAGQEAMVRDTYEFEDIAVSNAVGEISARLDRASSETVMDASFLEIGFTMNAVDLVDPLTKSTASQSLSLEGILIEVPRFFPAYMIEALSLQDTPRIIGDAAFKASTAKGDVTTSVNMALPGLGALVGGAKFGLPKSMDVTLPGFIADKLPIPGAVLDVTIHELDIAYQDDGIGEIIRAMTGMLPDAHFDRGFELAKVRLGDKLPAFVATKIDGAAEVLSLFLKGGGSIKIQPETPLTVMAIAMQGMMNADALSENMGLDVVLNVQE